MQAAADPEAALQQPLLPHLCDGTADKGRGGQQAQYHKQYLQLAAWLGVLFTGYAEQRVLCRLGFPNDGLVQIDFLEAFSDATSLLMYGSVLGWFVGITSPRRFHWLFSQQRWYVWATMLGTPPVYSAISNVGPLKHDLTRLADWGAPFMVLWSTAMCAILAVIVWHIVVVVRQRQWPDAVAYIASRVLLLAFLGGSAVALRLLGVNMHLHHLYLGWMLALWAELERPLSGVTLAIGTGIFLQGMAAYSAAPVFQHACFTSPSARSFACSFTSADGGPFSVQICPATGLMPQHSCST